MMHLEKVLRPDEMTVFFNIPGLSKIRIFLELIGLSSVIFVSLSVFRMRQVFVKFNLVSIFIFQRSKIHKSIRQIKTNKITDYFLEYESHW